MFEEADQAKGGVPLFQRWRYAYLAVAGIFVVEIAFFYFVSRHFL